MEIPERAANLGDALTQDDEGAAYVYETAGGRHVQGFGLAGLARMTLLAALTLGLAGCGSALNGPPVSRVCEGFQDLNYSADPQADGQKLRCAIDDRYRHLVKNHELKAPITDPYSITDSVLHFIPPGSSFSRAEIVLRAAGFQVTGRGRNIVFPTGEYAQIAEYRTIPLGSVSIGVVLYSDPTHPWQSVNDIDAEITTETL